MAQATGRADKIDMKAKPPLAGKRIVITRARSQAQDFALQLESLGGSIIEFPTIEIAAPADFTAFDAAMAQIESYHWLIFTSVNGVEPFLARLKKAGKSTSLLKRLKVGAIGPETAKRLAEAGISSCLVPDRFQAEGILDAFKSEDIRGRRFLIPRAEDARAVLPITLRDWGATVDVVVAYRTLLPPIDPAPLAALLCQHMVDVITFTSSSTAKNFVRLFGNRRLGEIAPDSALACIGPITARTVERLGGEAHIVAEEFTISGLVHAIVEHFERKPNLKGGGEQGSCSTQ